MRINHDRPKYQPQALATRRKFVRISLGATAVAIAFKDKVATAAAESRPALGTFPAGGIQGSSIFVGGVMPLTGPYSSSGKDMQAGFELAVKHLNEGSQVTEQISSLRSHKGVLGKKIETEVADSETKPDPAIQAASTLYS